jgi:hypothetical protein
MTETEAIEKLQSGTAILRGVLIEEPARLGSPSASVEITASFFEVAPQAGAERCGSP